MKKYILLYVLMFNWLFSAEILTDGKMSGYMGYKEALIRYIRSDIFNDIDISSIKLYVKNSGSLNFENEKIKSIEKKESDKLLINTDNLIVVGRLDSGKFILEIKNISDEILDVALEISPQKDNENIGYDFEEKNYNYENFIIDMEKNSKLYIGTENQFKKSSLRNIDLRMKKKQGENFYYILEKIEKSNPGKLEIKFTNLSKYPRNNIIFKDKIDDNYIVTKELSYLNLLMVYITTPEKIGLNKSTSSIETKLKLYYILSVYDDEFDFGKLFETLNQRKSEYEALLQYNMIFQLLNKKDIKIGDEKLKNRIVMETLALLDLLEIMNGEIIYIKDNIQYYYWYYNLLENVENREEFQSEKEFIQEKKQLIEKYILDNYYNGFGLKNSKNDKKTDKKNLRYLECLPENIRKEIIKREFEENYDSRYGILKEKNKNIDIEYNLGYILQLYKMKNKKLADEMLGNIENYIKNNNYYITSKIDNKPGIDGELLYWYFEVISCREQ